MAGRGRGGGGGARQKGRRTAHALWQRIDLPRTLQEEPQLLVAGVSPLQRPRRESHRNGAHGQYGQYGRYGTGPAARAAKPSLRTDYTVLAARACERSRTAWKPAWRGSPHGMISRTAHGMPPPVPVSDPTRHDRSTRVHSSPGIPATRPERAPRAAEPPKESQRLTPMSKARRPHTSCARRSSSLARVWCVLCTHVPLRR